MGEAAPCWEARSEVARSLAECIKRGDDAATLEHRWRGRAIPSIEVLELAERVIAGEIEPNGYYYVMSAQDGAANNWVDGDLVIGCGGYANHFYREWPQERMGMELKDYPIPRNKSKRGMHWSASCYPEEGHWQENLAWCADMGIGFIKFVEDGGGSGINVYRQCWFTHGIIPVVRFYIGTPGQCGPREEDAIKRISDMLGFRTYFELCNEPDLFDEWDGNRPQDWLQRSVNAYVGYAPKVWNAGGLPGTFALASGACTQRRIDQWGHVLDPVAVNFIKLIVDGLGGPAVAQNIGMWLSDHNYTINHPPDYPYDAVNQEGKPLTLAEYNSVPSWAWDGRSIESINAQRMKDKNPGDTIWNDDTCFNGYQIFLAYAKEAGIEVPLLTTEGGPTQTRGDDGRYAKVTEDIMMSWIPVMYRALGSQPEYFAHCHWLLYNTTNGWEADRWRWGSQNYDRVMNMFKATPVGTWGEKFGAVTPTPTPIPIPIPEPEPTPVPVPIIYPPLPVENDAGSYGVTIGDCNPNPGEWYWQIVKVHHYTEDENDGRQNLFMDVLDEKGIRINGAKIQVWWGSGRAGETAIAVVDKPDNEPGTNIPLWKWQVVNAFVLGEPMKSESILGVSTAHPDEPPGNTLFHHSFLCVWRRVQRPNVITPEPTPEPEIVTEDGLRDFGWNLLNIPWLPTAGFYLKAKELGLFGPRSAEGRKKIGSTTYAGQVFYGSQGDVLLWCIEGQWNKIEVVNLIPK